MKNNLTIQGRPFQPAHLIPVAGLAAALLWSYWPVLKEMAKAWTTEPEYSHGWLMPAFAAALLWFRRDSLRGADFRPAWWGLALLLVGLVLRGAGILYGIDSLEGLSLLAVLGGLVVLMGGGAAFRWSWPAVAFLVFMVPLPWRVKVMLANPLQQLATTVTTYVMQTLGLPAVAEGNKIFINDLPIEVAAACSGLNMLVTFFALSMAVAILINRPLGDRIVIFLSAVPIAVASNVIRIIVTALFMLWVSKEIGDKFFHDWAGYFMMPLALGFLWLELKLISWILIEPQPPDPKQAAARDKLAASAGGRRRGAPAPAR
jgi:exosortase